MKKLFHTVTTGKWILAGEHAVLRGCPALVFPLPSARLEFSFSPENPVAKDIELKLTGPRGAELDLLFWGVLEKACGLTGLRRNRLVGIVTINNQIPVGAGLGASAAFCVAVARWFAFESVIPSENIENFARELENLFHGESSGVDIAVAHGAKPIKFVRGGAVEVLDLKWQPNCYLTYSGQRGVTRECVNQVKDIWAQDPVLAKKLDQQMQSAVEMAEKALSLPKSDGQALLIQAVATASECFKSWGLFDPASQKKSADLLARGAKVLKPTGSGGGGYLLSVWDQDPKPADDLLPCFER